jgi:hypothetical protein
MLYFKRHDLIHLETHTNCAHKGTNNGIKNCAAPVMPQNRLDRVVKTLHLNAEIKAANTSIKVCQKSNSKKLWSDSPTSDHVTDPCESMLHTEWTHLSDWNPHRVEWYRWLLIHSPNKKFSYNNEWSDKDDDDEDKEDDDDDNDSESEDNEHPNKFGPIPCFSRVYEVTIHPDTLVFSCTCCRQERMGMPCRHIALICHSNTRILGYDPKGFPLSSIRVFWWNKYYLYGMSKKPDHQKIKSDLLALANNDTEGVAFHPSTLDDPSSISDPSHFFKAFH